MKTKKITVDLQLLESASRLFFSIKIEFKLQSNQKPNSKTIEIEHNNFERQFLEKKENNGNKCIHNVH